MSIGEVRSDAAVPQPRTYHQIDHPITAHKARLSAMAKTHGIGDENRIVRLELLLATAAFGGVSTSCG
jgi:hypothetical protein